MSVKPTILLPIDHSPWAIRALDTGRIFAEELGAHLHLLHIEQACRRPINPDWISHFDFEIQGPRVTLEIKEGDPVAEILHAAETIESLLMILLPTHGETSNLGLRMGHVPEQILEKAKVPVVLTRRNMDIPLQLKRILIPLDGSEASGWVVPWVKDLANRAHAEIQLLYVVSAKIKPLALSGQYAPPQYIDYPQHDWNAWEQELLTRFFHPQAFITQEDLSVELFLSHGMPENAIVHFAKEHQVDLIAMGWRGVLKNSRGGIFKRVIETASCPVLGYHP